MANNYGRGYTGGYASPPTSPSPFGVSGTWVLDFRDEFTGSSLDTSKWVAKNDSNPSAMNNVALSPTNVTVANGQLVLTLSSSTVGAAISSAPGEGATVGYLLPTNAYAEASVYFPGDGTNFYNWPAWWISGSNWPSNGENDIAEVLGQQLTANYHGGSTAGSDTAGRNGPQVPGYWQNGYHTYGIYRRAAFADIYWDGKLVQSYPTGDLGGGECLLVNIGASGTAVTGAAGQVKVDYVRTWLRSGAEPVFTPISETFSGGAQSGAPTGWTQQSFYGPVAVDSNARLSLTTAAAYYGLGPSVIWSAMEPTADVDVTADVGFSNLLEQYPNISIRATYPRYDNPYPRDGYTLELAPNNNSYSIQVTKYGVNASSAIGGTSFTFTNGTRVNVRFQAIGSTIRAKVWNVGSSEPGTWGISVTDTSVTTPGRVMISGSTGADSVARTATWDNVSATTTSVAYSGSASLSGSGTLTSTSVVNFSQSSALSGSGTLTLTSVPKPAQTSGLSGSGTLTSSSVPKPTQNSSLSGSGTLTTSGGLTSSGVSNLSGAGTLSSAFVPKPVQSFSLSGSGTLTNSGLPKPSNTVAFSGSGSLSIAPTPLNYELGISIPAYSGKGGGILFAGTTEMQGQINAAVAAGVGWLRVDMVLQQADPNNTGTYDWSAWDSTFTYAKSKGMKILGIVMTTVTPTDSTKRTTLANFAVAIANRYTTGTPYEVNALEVMNECNLERFWPSPSASSYGQALQAVYTAVKAVKPGLTVITCGTGGAGASANDISTDQWYLSLFSGGYIAYTDALTLHTYSNFTTTPGNGEEGWIVPLRQYADSNGAANKPMWSTETGAPTGGSYGVSEADQATILTNSWNYFRANAGNNHGPMFVYTLEDFATAGSSTDAEDYFGLRRYNYSVKPSYGAVRTMSGTSSSDYFASANLAGSGTLSSSNSLSTSGSSNLSGSGTLTSSGKPNYSAASSLTGSGTLTLSGKINSSSGANLSGSGTLSSSANVAASGTDTLSGSGTLTLSAIVSTSSSSSLSGSGTLTSSANSTVTQTSALSGSGSLTSAANPTVSQTSGLSGSGTLTSTSVANSSGSLNLSGSGTVLAGGVSNPKQNVNLSGSGTLTSSSSLTSTGSSNLSGSGTLTLSGGINSAAPVTLSGSGTLTQSGSFVQTGSLNSSGSGTLNLVATQVTQSGSGGLSGNGSLTYSTTSSRSDNSALSGSGALGLTTTQVTFVGSDNLSGGGAVVPTTQISASGNSNLSSSGTLTASGVVGVSGTSALSGSGSLTSTAQGSSSSNLGVSGSGTLSSIGSVALSGAESNSGAGTLTTSSTLNAAGSSNLSGSGTLGAAGASNNTTTATLGGSGTLSSVSSAAINSAANTSGSGLLIANGVFGAVGSIALSGFGTLNTSSAGNSTGSTNVSGSGTLSASGVVVLNGFVSSDGSGTLNAVGSASVSGTTPLGGTGTLNGVTVLTANGVAALNGSGSLTVNISSGSAGSTDFSGGGTLTLSGSVSPSAAVSLSGSGSTSLAALLGVNGTVSLSGNGSLTTRVDSYQASVPLFGDGALSLDVSASIVTLVGFSGSGTLTAVSSSEVISIGPDQTADSFGNVLLTSNVPNLVWSQIAGPTVILVPVSDHSYQFVAPATRQDTTLIFSATDGNRVDTVNVIITRHMWWSLENGIEKPVRIVGA